MNKLTFLRGNSLDRLQSNITPNQHLYSEAAPWLSSYFSGSSWLQESNLVQIGGVTIIDALDEPDLRELVSDKIEQLAAA